MLDRLFEPKHGEIGIAFELVAVVIQLADIVLRLGVARERARRKLVVVRPKLVAAAPRAVLVR